MEQISKKTEQKQGRKDDLQVISFFFFFKKGKEEKCLIHVKRKTQIKKQAKKNKKKPRNLAEL